MAKVLIVDDQKSVLLILESILNKVGYYTVSATSTSDALEKLNEHKFDLVITDAIMPGGKSGFNLTCTIREKPELKDLPVIILTGRREKADVQRGIDSGANDYIIKPIDPEILLAKVDGLLNKGTNRNINFPECPISVEAQFEDETQIISLSEVGLTLMSNVSVAIGSRIKLKTKLFEEIGIKTPFLRVINCEPLDKDKNRFAMSVHFVGVSEKEFQPLRLYIASKRKGSAA